MPCDSPSHDHRFHQLLDASLCITIVGLDIVGSVGASMLPPYLFISLIIIGTEGIGKFPGNMLGDRWKKAIGLVARMPEAVGLSGMKVATRRGGQRQPDPMQGRPSTARLAARGSRLLGGAYKRTQRLRPCRKGQPPAAKQHGVALCPGLPLQQG
ncbi:hypothetical protein B296_00054590 [Ensete ventricosum]|uniref:Uncharacterized protein n=1 Tax=Ensete ventricosum TaxID=4639 RepID=A0A426XL52_ENSVE|nr:hypothetical protein B296_00054590 [Ensete ventricosum]